MIFMIEKKQDYIFESTTQSYLALWILFFCVNIIIIFYYIITFELNIFINILLVLISIIMMIINV